MMTLHSTLAAEWAEEEAAEATRRREARAAVECEREGLPERERQVRLCYHPFSIAPSDSTVGVYPLRYQLGEPAGPYFLLA